MKRLIGISFLMVVAVLIMGQAPQAFNYQAILRNTDGTIKASESVAIQISIIHGHTDGPPVYMEIHDTITSELGLVNLVIGEGATSDDLSTVDWASGPYYIDITVNGVNMGSSPLLSVPYSLYAASGNEGPPGPQGIQGDIGLQGEPGDTKWEEVIGGISYSEGRVGIGTENPLAQLDVAGDLHVKGVIIVEGEDGDSITLTMEDFTTLMQKIEDLKAISFGNYTVTDIDGNIYKTVIIGHQMWMAENIRVTHYPDGTPIPYVEDSAVWSGLDSTQRAYCWYNNDSLHHADVYGALYTWGAAMNGAESSNSDPSGIQGVCPDGWHLPSDSEWFELEYFLGMTWYDLDEEGAMRGTDQGYKLKEGYLPPGYHDKLWGEADASTNETGFSARPGGYRSPSGEFQLIGSSGTWWSSRASWFKDLGPEFYGGYWRGLARDQGGIARWCYNLRHGYSVRCVRD